MLLRVQEAAKLLKVSTWTIYRWIEEGRLRAIKIGPNSVRVYRTSVSDLIKATPIDRQDTEGGLTRKVTPVRGMGRKKKK